MGTFIVAYALVWLVLALYVFRLRNEQRRLDRRAQWLEARVRDLAVPADEEAYAAALAGDLP